LGKIEKLTKEGWKKLADKNYKRKMRCSATADLEKVKSRG